jgi:hypothetical protein
MTRWSTYYAAGCAMGFPPRDVDEMTLWEFACCADGYRKANQAEESPPPMDDNSLAELGIEGFN